ncbi:response regulator [Mucilaginibacter sp.]|uniref:response regulator n=1 Tax=Mucilaginibacter sp. TaxID=1882438 RepID=UPI003D0BB5B8
MSKRILIVEDDHDILSLLTDVLNQEGYEVAGLDHTHSITNSINEHKPDLVMLDFLIPGINGGELCHEIKTTAATAKLPVIMLSGFPRVLESLGNYGSDGFIAKPFDIDVVIHTVQQCLSNNAELV